MHTSSEVLPSAKFLVQYKLRWYGFNQGFPNYTPIPFKVQVLMQLLTSLVQESLTWVQHIRKTDLIRRRKLSLRKVLMQHISLELLE